MELHQPLFNRFEEFPSVYCVQVDLNGKYVYVNDAFKERYRHLGTSFINHDFRETVSMTDLVKCKAVARRCLKNPQATITTQFHNYDAEGNDIWTKWEFSAIKDPLNVIVGIQGIGADVTADMTGKATLQSALDRLHDLIFIIDYNYTIHSFNEQASKEVGAILGKKISPGDCFKDLFTGQFRDRLHMLFERALLGETVSTETLIQCGRKEFVLNVIFMPVIEKRLSVRKVMVSVVDITERGLVENTLQDGVDVKKCIVTEVMKAKEDERMKIAGELHDNVSQLLVTSKLLLSVVQADPKQGSDLLPKITDLISKSINEIRELSHEIISPALKDYKLSEEISNMTEMMRVASGIDISFIHDNIDDIELSNFDKLNIYRIIQEATNNILKHANATRIDIHFRNWGNKLELRIKDNGKGFDRARAKKGAGLINIRNRVKLLKASHTLESEPGKGTLLGIVMPLVQNFSI